MAANLPAINGHDIVSISFGSGEKSKSTRTWKQYFSDLYTKVCNQIRKFINSIKSFFKKPAKNQAGPNTPKDASDTSANTPDITKSRQLTDLPEDSNFPEMTPDETANKVRQLIEYRENGKTYDDLNIADQCFLRIFINETLNDSNPANVDLGKGIADLYGISIENT